MAWEVLQEVAKRVPRLKAAITVLKDKVARFDISISDSLLKELGNPKACRVMIGTGEHAGKVMIDFKLTDVPLKSFPKGGARARATASYNVPRDRREATAMTIESNQNGVVIALLPEEWSKSSAAPPLRQNVVRHVTPEKDHRDTNSKVKIIPYLSGKGHKVAQTKSGWVIDGDQVDKAGALRVINRHRSEQQLRTLMLDEID